MTKKISAVRCTFGQIAEDLKKGKNNNEELMIKLLIVGTL
tara:strand:+ start:381 stop:500 length:120 start_codon:yes stop_codon:yes gene_type:complete